MGFQERVTIYIETKVDSAKSQLGQFKSSVAEAEGATGKLKAAASGLGNIVNSAASALLSPAGLAAGAGAIGAAAVKSVKQFEELGLTIGKVAAATGLSAEEASRWVEVADDAGVSSEAFTKSVGFMEKALGKNADAFDAWGVTVAKNADGTVNMNQTLLNAMDAINAISDPLKKQAAGAAIFGKSWQDMAELIARGSGTLKDNLAAVQDTKVFSAKDISTARDVRDGFDAISDAVDGLYLTMGKSLAPAVAQVATKLGDLITKGEPAFKSMGDGISQTITDLGPLIDGLGKVAEGLGKLHGINWSTGIPNGKDFTPFAGSTDPGRRGDRRRQPGAEGRGHLPRPQRAVRRQRVGVGPGGRRVRQGRRLDRRRGRRRHLGGRRARPVQPSTEGGQRRPRRRVQARGLVHQVDRGGRQSADRSGRRAEQAGRRGRVGGRRPDLVQRRNGRVHRQEQGPQGVDRRRARRGDQRVQGAPVAVRVDDRDGRGDGDGDGQARRPERHVVADRGDGQGPANGRRSSSTSCS